MTGAPPRRMSRLGSAAALRIVRTLWPLSEVFVHFTTLQSGLQISRPVSSRPRCGRSDLSDSFLEPRIGQAPDDRCSALDHLSLTEMLDDEVSTRSTHGAQTVSVCRK